MRGRGNILYNLGILGVAQAATMLLSVVALVYIARTVGQHWFGVLQVGAAFSAYALLAAEWGLCVLGIREVSRLDALGEILRYARTHVGLMLVMALGVLAVGAVVLPLFPFFADDPWIFLLYLATVVPQFWTLDWVGVGLERMTWVGIAKTSRSLFYVALVLLLLEPLDGFGGWPAHRWVPLMFLAAFCGSALVMLLRVRVWLGAFVTPRLGPRAEWRRRMGAAGPIGASALTMRVLLNSDVILLGMLVTPAEVGSYAAAAKVIFVLVVAVEVLWRALLPRLSRFWAESEADFRRSYLGYLGLAAALFLPVAVGGVLLGGRFMDLLYGDGYPGAGIVFRLLSVSYVMLALGQFCGNALIASDRQRLYFPPLLLSAAVAVAGNLLLVPRLGPSGACFGMMLAHATLLATTGWIIRGLLGRELLAPLLAGTVGSVSMALVLRATWSWHPVVLIVEGVVVYAAVAGPMLLSWWRRRA